MGISISTGGGISAGRDIVIQEGNTSEGGKDKGGDAENDIAQKLETIMAKLYEQNQANIADQIKTNLPAKGSPATEHLCSLITAAGVLVSDISPLANAVLQFFRPSPTGAGK